MEDPGGPAPQGNIPVPAPAPEPAPAAVFSPTPELSYDVEESTPLADFLAILRRPRTFFIWFRGREALSYWVMGKALAGFLFLLWLAAFVRGGHDLVEHVEALSPFVDAFTQYVREHIPWFGGDFDPAEIRTRLAMGSAAMAQFSVLVRPLTELFALFLTVTTAYVFLPFVGVAKESRSFGRLFFAGVFANWFAWLSVLPGGNGLAALVSAIYFVLAVKWIHGLSLGRAFLAVYLIGWLVIALMAFVGAIVLALLISMLPGLSG